MWFYKKLYYLKNRIYLVQRNAVTDNNIWTSEKNKEKQLRLALSDALRKELDSITKAAVPRYIPWTLKNTKMITSLSN